MSPAPEIPRKPPHEPTPRERGLTPADEYADSVWAWYLEKFYPHEPAKKRLPTTYDRIFALHGAGLPVAYLRTLAAFESGFSAKAHKKGSQYYGMFQVDSLGPGVLASYNKAHATKWGPDDMFNVVKNTKVASWYLNRIIAAYKSSNVPELNPPNPWLDPEWVALLTAGWNSGHSRKAGVQFVAKKLHDAGVRVTHNEVFARANKLGATKHLSNNKKRIWQRKVAAMWTRERRHVPRKTGAFAAPAAKGAPWIWLLVAWLVIRQRS